MTARTAHTEEIKDELEQAAEKAGRYARSVLEQSSHLGDSAESLAKAIREEPVKATLIAAGVGLLLGMLIKR